MRKKLFSPTIHLPVHSYHPAPAFNLVSRRAILSKAYRYALMMPILIVFLNAALFRI